MIKRDATPEEEQEALVKNYERWNLCNPGYDKLLSFWEEKLDEAKKEGYKTEICECGATFMAFHHMLDCRQAECPMKSSNLSILDQIAAKFEEEEKENKC